jgi:hypothetical protein
LCLSISARATSLRYNCISICAHLSSNIFHTLHCHHHTLCVVWMSL